MNGDISYMATKSLLEKLSKEEKQLLLQHLDNELLEKLRQEKITFDFSIKMKNKEEIISAIHFTWLISFFENLSQNDQGIFLVATSGSQQTALFESLSIAMIEGIPSPLLKEYLSDILFSFLLKEEKGFLPEEFLPKNPLNVLLNISYENFLFLFNFLGLHDLAIDLKKQIRSSIIKNVFSSLSDEEVQYVKKMQNRKEEVEFGPLHLDKWNKDPKSLQKLIHGRGMNRFAKAIYGSHPGLLWHVSHRMDKKRAAFLTKHSVDIKNTHAKERLIYDILELIPKK